MIAMGTFNRPKTAYSYNTKDMPKFLPIEIIERILTYCSPRDRCLFRRISSNYNAAYNLLPPTTARDFLDLLYQRKLSEALQYSRLDDMKVLDLFYQAFHSTEYREFLANSGMDIYHSCSCFDLLCMTIWSEMKPKDAFSANYLDLLELIQDFLWDAFRLELPDLKCITHASLRLLEMLTPDETDENRFGIAMFYDNIEAAHACLLGICTKENLHEVDGVLIDCHLRKAPETTLSLLLYSSSEKCNQDHLKAYTESFQIQRDSETDIDFEEIQQILQSVIYEALLNEHINLDSRPILFSCLILMLFDEKAMEILIAHSAVKIGLFGNPLLRLCIWHSRLDILEKMMTDTRIDVSEDYSDLLMSVIDDNDVDSLEVLLRESTGLDPSLCENDSFIFSATYLRFNVFQRLLEDPRIDPSDRDNEAFEQIFYRLYKMGFPSNPEMMGPKNNDLLERISSDPDSDEAIAYKMGRLLLQDDRVITKLKDLSPDVEGFGLVGSVFEDCILDV